MSRGQICYSTGFEASTIKDDEEED